MMTTIHLMLEDGLAPEDIDAITGAPMAHPKSASFRTADLVGLDTFVHVADNCFASLVNDEDREVFEVPPYIRAMVEKKLLGDKTKGGFYRRDKASGEIETLDPKTLEYRASGGDEGDQGHHEEHREDRGPEGARCASSSPIRARRGSSPGRCSRGALAYSARRIGEIADDVVAIDDAMKWGYNWELGPFETWDALGFAETTDADEEGRRRAARRRSTKMKAAGAKGFYTDGDGRGLRPRRRTRTCRAKVDPRTATLTVAAQGAALPS